MARRSRGKGNFNQFIKEVEKAVKHKRKPGSGLDPVSQANLKPAKDMLANISKAPQCIKVTKQLGRKCTRPAMKGAKHCHLHGGYREVPSHPATVRKLLKGELYEEQARKAAYQRVREFQFKDKLAVQDALEARGLNKTEPITLLNGLIAYTTDDNGKAYRHWLKHLST